MAEPGLNARTLAAGDLAAALRESRRQTLSWSCDLSAAQWMPPRARGVNPLAWELAHLAWFAEFFVLRGPHGVDEHGRLLAAHPARLAGPDSLLDSGRLDHDARWGVQLPGRERVLGMLEAQLAACLEALPSRSDDGDLYFHRLALFHEDMHGEALAWLRASLGYPAPEGLRAMPALGNGTLAVDGGPGRIGWPQDAPGFAFDNELDGCTVELAAFEVDAAPVAAGDYLRFVEAGGYDDPRYWPGLAGAWRAVTARSHPGTWRRSTAVAGGWERRHFDRWLPLEPELPVLHVTCWEAEAYCHWARRRLPTAAEWERAACTAGAPFRWGHSVWEWTASDFLPYPGFTAGPYAAYSRPWFGGDHRELRGGAFATHDRMHHPRYRNFFTPGRDDVFSGFRTAALTG